MRRVLCHWTSTPVLSFLQLCEQSLFRPCLFSMQENHCYYKLYHFISLYCTQDYTSNTAAAGWPTCLAEVTILHIQTCLEQSSNYKWSIYLSQSETSSSKCWSGWAMEEEVLFWKYTPNQCLSIIAQDRCSPFLRKLQRINEAIMKTKVKTKSEVPNRV